MAISGKIPSFSSKFDAPAKAWDEQRASRLSAGNFAVKEKDLHRPTWLTGTNSSTLAMMIAINRAKLFPFDQPALIPASQLREKGIIPLAGESRDCEYLAGTAYPHRNLARGYSNVSLNDFVNDRNLLQNADKILLYWLKPFDILENFGDLFSRIMKLETAIDRMLRREVLSDFERTELCKKIQITLLPLCDSFESFRACLWDQYPGSKPYDHKLCGWTSQDHFLKSFSEENYKIFYEKVNLIISQLSNFKPFLSMNEQEKDLIINPCPLIFASHSISGELLPDYLGKPGELAVHHPLLLGKDIQKLYTLKEKVQLIQSLTHEYRVTVHSFEDLK